MGVHVLAMVIGHDGVTAHARTVLRSQVLVLHLPRKYKFGERRVAAKLVTCLMQGDQKITISSCPLWSVRCQLVSLHLGPISHLSRNARMLGASRFQ